MPSLRFYKEYMKVIPDPLTVKLDNGKQDAYRSPGAYM